jgi:hypothetical protein
MTFITNRITAEWPAPLRVIRRVRQRRPTHLFMLAGDAINGWLHARKGEYRQWQLW